MTAYKTQGALRKALEERLKQKSKLENVDINRLRRQLAFDRLLARLFHDEAAPWALKGGYALELQFKAARSTVDIDLTMFRPVAIPQGTDINQAVRELLQEAASLSLGDWLEYKIGAMQVDITAAPYGGARYPVEVRMDDRIFARFHLDVGIGDVAMQPLTAIETYDWLGFTGIAAPRIRMIAKEQQFAEKIHAYTLPRPTPNSRVKDLVDLALLVHAQDLDQERVALALQLTFERRGTHLQPGALTPPPEEWQRPFEALAAECGLPASCESAFVSVNSFLHRVMAER
jgi:hypothetical protein